MNNPPIIISAHTVTADFMSSWAINPCGVLYSKITPIAISRQENSVPYFIMFFDILFIFSIFSFIFFVIFVSPL